MCSDGVLEGDGISIVGNIYIGLAVHDNNDSQLCTVEFSSVSMPAMVDLTGDGTNDSTWAPFDISSSRYFARYAVHVEDLTGRINVNMAGNLADPNGANPSIHSDGLGFDPFEISLERLIREVPVD